MLVQAVNLINYRNYGDLQLNFHPSLNIFIGDNAQGKTNILEAILFTLTGKSHRTSHDHDLIKSGENYFKIRLIGKRLNTNVKIEIMTRSDAKKILKVNGNIKRKLTELIGIINVVMFSPEDMMLVKGSPSVRRRFLDIEISQTTPFYCYTLANYNKALTQRNNLLKLIRENKENQSLLDVYDEKIVEFGTYLFKKRNEVINKIAPIAANFHHQITDGKEELTVQYLPSVDFIKKENFGKLEDLYIKLLKDNRKGEIFRGITSIGPHRDDILLKIGNTDIRVFGSQGQQRTSALSLKLSEIEYMKMETGEYPILLLDDVMSELDAGRRKFLLKTVGNKTQTFVTSTEVDDKFDILKSNSRIYEVNAGVIRILQEG